MKTCLISIKRKHSPVVKCWHHSYLLDTFSWVNIAHLFSLFTYMIISRMKRIKTMSDQKLYAVRVLFGCARLKQMERKDPRSVSLDTLSASFQWMITSISKSFWALFVTGLVNSKSHQSFLWHCRCGNSIQMARTKNSTSCPAEAKGFFLERKKHKAKVYPKFPSTTRIKQLQEDLYK